MIAGGVCLATVAALTGELSQVDLANSSSRSLLGFLYLVTFGSLIGFTAYFYVLAHTTAAKAATYAYVNPVVAVFLGTALVYGAARLHLLWIFFINARVFRSWQADPALGEMKNLWGGDVDLEIGYEFDRSRRK